MDFYLTVTFIFLHQSQMLFFHFHDFHYILACYACQLGISLYRRPWQLGKGSLEDSSCLFFLSNIFNMLVKIVFQHQSLGNLDTNTFLSRGMIIYSYTLLPVIKPFPYLRQNIFHNNKETKIF